MNNQNNTAKLYTVDSHEDMWKELETIFKMLINKLKANTLQ